MIFYATSDEIAMIGILRCVSIGKATYYKKILLNLDKAEGALTSLIKKYNVSLGTANLTEHACAGHMVVQLNQTLLEKKQCMVYLMITLPKALRSQADLYQKLVADLEVVDSSNLRPEDRKKIAIEWQKEFICKSFITKSNPNPDVFNCLEWEHERLYIYTKDQVRKLVLRRSDYTAAQLKKQEALAAKNLTEAKKIKPSRWTWHVTSHYQKYIRRVAEVKIQAAIAAKKAQKTKEAQKSTKKTPDKSEIGRVSKLTPQEVAACVSDAVFLVRYMPAFSGTASDVGKIVSELEWRFNAKEIKVSKAVRSKDGKARKVSMPITQAFKVREMATRASYNLSRFQFKYYSFAELLEAIETFKEGLEEVEKAHREERIISIYELEKRQVKKELFQKNTEGKKLSKIKVLKLVDEIAAKRFFNMTGFRTEMPKKYLENDKS
jgi:hypothetical protein